MSTDVERLIQEIRSLSVEQQRRVRAALAEQPPGGSGPSACIMEPADENYQKRLVKAGLLTKMRPRRRDQQAFDRYRPLDISGKPLSETIIEERR